MHAVLQYASALNFFSFLCSHFDLDELDLVVQFIYKNILEIWLIKPNLFNFLCFLLNSLLDGFDVFIGHNTRRKE